MSETGRIVFLGTPEFAVPLLRTLAESEHEVAGVVSQPDRPVGRKRVSVPTPVKQAALELGLKVVQPERIRSEEAYAAITAWRPDVLITAAYGQLIPERLLRTARVAALNLHASLLPKYRGAAPIQRALMDGEAVTGVSVMTMVKAMDAGPVWAQAQLAIEPEETYGELGDRLAALGAHLLLATLPGVLSGTLTPIEQDAAMVTYAPRIERTDEWLDFRASAVEVANKVRALAPAPGASTRLGDQTLKVWQATPVVSAARGVAPGRVLEVGTRGILVACKDGGVWLMRVQAAGKNPLDGLAYARGRRDLVGRTFVSGTEAGERV